MRLGTVLHEMLNTTTTTLVARVEVRRRTYLHNRSAHLHGEKCKLLMVDILNWHTVFKYRSVTASQVLTVLLT